MKLLSYRNKNCYDLFYGLMHILSEAPCPYICRSAGAVCEGDVDVVEGEAVAKLVAYYLYRPRKPKSFFFLLINVFCINVHTRTYTYMNMCAWHLKEAKQMEDLCC